MSMIARDRSRWMVWLIGLGVGVGLLTSCEDQIELDLNDASPQIVIVGEITNRQKSHTITIHQTVPVSSGELSDPVSGAIVRVTEKSSNSNGRVFVFNQANPGQYHSCVFRGIIGVQYVLEVEYGSKTFTATSQMPPVVNID